MKKQIKFDKYFYKWLYGEDGYYSNYKDIGKSGDFFTAVSTSKFFGGSIAKKIISSIKSGALPKDTTIIEIGAHHGYLLADIIEFIYTLEPKLLDTLNFAIVERYKHLQQKQKEYFQDSFGDIIKLIHFDNINKVDKKHCFFIANEIFDAFPCDLVYTTKEDQLQYGVVEDHKIIFKDNDNPYITNYCKKYSVTKGEIARGYEQFAKDMCTDIEKFEFITFDYGEKYPRNDFSCRVYKNHQVFPIFDENIVLKDLYCNSDITYDVNFTHLIDSFNEAGAINITYETQLKALVDFGIIELLEILHKNVDEKTYLKEANKVKTLLNPTGMGDRFKMAHFRFDKSIG